MSKPTTNSNSIRHSEALLIAWRLAELESANLGSNEIEPVHFLLGLLKLVDIDLDALLRSKFTMDEAAILAPKQQTKLLEIVFENAGIESTRLRRRLRTILRTDCAIPSKDGRLRRNSLLREAFRMAEADAASDGTGEVQPVHVLVALLKLPDTLIAEALATADASSDDLETAVVAVLQNQPAPAALADNPTLAEDGRQIKDDVEKELVHVEQKKKHFIDRIGRDLTMLAKEGKLVPVIGRRAEMRSLAQVMLRSRKNNVILVGEAGVGKTCIVEGFAQRIVEGGMPPEFAGIRIVEISMAALVAGTGYRGDLEARLERLLAEAKNNPEIILFIDEIHMLVGAGKGSGGSMDAANILKPALARGEIRVIGATTTAEYRRFIESDAALARRFERIEVAEPSRDEAVELLKGLRERFENHHHVRITDDALEAAVDYSIRYLSEQRLPDKAIDIVDQACSQTRMQSLSRDFHAQFVEGITIGRKQIAGAVAHRCRVPVGDITDDESNRLLQIEGILKQRIKGQDHAIVVLAESIRLARSGLKNPNKPVGVFLFTGPSGTGKTELAKALADFLFGNDRGLLRFDMSEFMEEHSVSKLIGSPPGFIGHEHGGQLTEKIRSHPFSVVLLDEIEKAHPKVVDIFLQVFDTGILTDAQGRKCDFRESVIIMTSNLGSVTKRPSMGFKNNIGNTGDGGLMEGVHEALAKYFRPEFLNRLTEIVVFRSLEPETVCLIIDSIIERLNRRLEEKKISLVIDQSARDLLMAEGFNSANGAREMERTVERLIAKPLSRLMLLGEAKQGALVRCSANRGEMLLEFTSGGQ